MSDQQVVFELTREVLTPEFTLGRILLNGAHVCYTVEDAVRAGRKIPKVTAIPAGDYKVKVTWSPRFQRRLPLLYEVPGFMGIRIHRGNNASHSEGCIIVGRNRSEDGVFDSAPAELDIIRRIDSVYTSGKEAWLSVY